MAKQRAPKTHQDGGPRGPDSVGMLIGWRGHVTRPWCGTYIRSQSYQIRASQEAGPEAGTDDTSALNGQPTPSQVRRDKHSAMPFLLGGGPQNGNRITG